MAANIRARFWFSGLSCFTVKRDSNLQPCFIRWCTQFIEHLLHAILCSCSVVRKQRSLSFFFWLCRLACQILITRHQGWNPGLWQWEHKVLTHDPGQSGNSLKDPFLGTSLAVYWLRLGASTARGTDSIPGQSNKILHATPGQKQNKRKEKSLSLRSLYSSRGWVKERGRENKEVNYETW